jgi:hypothetical protein|tara:strand:+ start:682 stop:852 length:171 start_codon:yes stop_codon:yes gene_type:complete
MDTPDNIKYGNQTAGYRMRYKQMIEKHNQDKKKKKKDKGETLQERMSRILYGGSNK